MNSQTDTKETISKLLFPVSYVSHLAVILGEKPYANVLEKVGLTERVFERQDGKINGKQFLNIHLEAQRKTELPRPFSLQVGKQFNIATHGVLGLALMSAKNIGEALQLGSRYSHLMMPAVSIDFSVNESYRVILRHTVNMGDLSPMLMEVCMCVMQCIFEQCAEPITFKKITFSHSNVDHVEIKAFESYFNCPVQFSCAENTIEIEPFDFQTPMKNKDVYTNSMLVAQLEKLEKNKINTSSWKYKVEEYGQKNMHRLAQLNKQEIADALHVTPRTLTRKLQIENANVQQIIDEIVRQNACYLLRSSKLSLQEISARLGFADAKYFSRSFKRLTQLTPTQYRASA